MQSKPHAQLNWLALAPILIAIALFPVAWKGLSIEWFSGEQDNSHALPSFIAALFIAFTSQFKLVKQQPLRLILLLILSILLCTAYFTFQLANITQLTYMTAVAGSILLYVWLFGFRPFHTLILVCVLLALSLPIWDALLEPLVVLASNVVTWFVGWFKITVLIEGNSILTPYGRILIAEGCSGIRYLLVAVVLGALVAHVNHYRLFGTVVALAIFTTIGLFSNWVRITLLIFTGYFTEMESSLMHDHEIFGWVVYSVFFLPIIYFAPKGKPLQRQESSRLNLNFTPTLICLTILIVTVNGGLLAIQSQFSATTAVDDQLLAKQFTKKPLPAELKSLPISDLNTLIWYQSKTSNTMVGTFSNAKSALDEKLVPYIPQSLVNGQWFNESQHTLHLQGLNANVQQLKSLFGNQRVLRVQIYHTGTLWSSDYNIAKLHQVPALLSGNNQFTYHLFITPCVTFNCENAVNELSRDIQGILPQ